MTHDLVERMVGHRTRLAQEPRERWHEGEDQAVERYLGLSAGMDRSAAHLMALVPRGWLLVALAGIAPAFISGQASTAALAVALGGILMALGAFKKLAGGLSNLIGAAIAWKQVASLFHAAARAQSIGSPSIAVEDQGPSAKSGKGTVAEGHDLVFRYRDRGEPVLSRCSLRVAEGDRVLLEGRRRQIHARSDTHRPARSRVGPAASRRPRSPYARLRRLAASRRFRSAVP